MANKGYPQEKTTDGPWWSRLAFAAVDLIYRLGVVGFIALVMSIGAVGLGWFTVVQLIPVLTDMDSFMRTQSDQDKKLWTFVGKLENNAIADRQQEREREQAGQEALFQIEQQTCINAAKSKYQQVDKCLEIRNTQESEVNKVQPYTPIDPFDAPDPPDPPAHLKSSENSSPNIVLGK